MVVVGPRSRKKASNRDWGTPGSKPRDWDVSSRSRLLLLTPTSREGVSSCFDTSATAALRRSVSHLYTYLCILYLYKYIFFPLFPFPFFLFVSTPVFFVCSSTFAFNRTFSASYLFHFEPPHPNLPSVSLILTTVGELRDVGSPSSFASPSRGLRVGVLAESLMVTAKLWKEGRLG